MQQDYASKKWELEVQAHQQAHDLEVKRIDELVNLRKKEEDLLLQLEDKAKNANANDTGSLDSRLAAEAAELKQIQAEEEKVRLEEEQQLKIWEVKMIKVSEASPSLK